MLTMPSSLQFASFTLDLNRLCLFGPSGQVDLRPKSFEVLRHLVEHAGRVVGKEEVIEAVWPDVIVTDESLTQCISEIRRALGDRSQRIIKTVPKRGYLFDVPVSAGDAVPHKGVRFVGEVREVQQATAAADIQAEKLAAPRPLPDRPSIAVLPLDNASGDREQDYFSVGITEDIITELSRFSDLFVIAHNSSLQYKGMAVDVRQVGRELGVHYVLQGSIRRGGDRVRISVQLIDAQTGIHRWAERYERQLQDVFAVQDDVARTIVAILAAHLNKAEIERSLNKPPDTWQAYDYYLRAADAHASFLSSYKAAELYEVRRLLEQSIAIDPSYAPAYARLAFSYLNAWITPLDGDYINPAALDRAYQLARKAVQLGPNLPQARAQLGHILVHRGEHEAALAEFERAMALNPNFTDWRLGEALAFAGDPARAIEAIERHMRFDPFYAPLAPGFLGFAHYMLKQYSQALPWLRECASRSPNLRAGHSFLAATYAQLGDIERARAEAAEVLRIDPRWTIEGARMRLTFKRPEDAEHCFDGLRKAGLPER
jgi:adenylate cyclase